MARRFAGHEARPARYGAAEKEPTMPYELRVEATVRLAEI